MFGQVLRHENRSCFEQGRHRRISSPVKRRFRAIDCRRVARPLREYSFVDTQKQLLVSGAGLKRSNIAHALCGRSHAVIEKFSYSFDGISMPVFERALLGRIARKDPYDSFVIHQRNADRAPERRRETRRHLNQIQMSIGVHCALSIGRTPSCNSLTEFNHQAWQ